MLLGVALVATLYYYPNHYGDLILLRQHVTWILLARDLVVVALVAELLRVLLEPEPAAEDAPAPAPAPEALPALP
jgi:hypothetical protein